jgi:hypothetical protein
VERRTVLGAGAPLAVVACAWSVVSVDRVPADLDRVVRAASARLELLERVETLSPRERVGEYENLVYYKLAKTLDTGVDWVTPVLR